MLMSALLLLQTVICAFKSASIRVTFIFAIVFTVDNQVEALSHCKQGPVCASSALLHHSVDRSQLLAEHNVACLCVPYDTCLSVLSMMLRRASIPQKGQTVCHQRFEGRLHNR